VSKIEELIYSAYEHGQRSNLFNEVSKLRITNPHMKLEDIYEEAYSIVMKTR